MAALVHRFIVVYARALHGRSFSVMLAIYASHFISRNCSYMYPQVS